MANFDFDVVVKIGSMALIRKEDNDLDYNIFNRLASELKPERLYVSCPRIPIQVSAAPSRKTNTSASFVTQGRGSRRRRSVPFTRGCFIRNHPLFVIHPEKKGEAAEGPPRKTRWLPDYWVTFSVHSCWICSLF